MNSTTLRVEDNMVVSFAYELTAKGQGDQRKEEKSTKQVVQGRKQVTPGLEKALYGMSVGEEKNVVVDPSQGYGEVKPEGIRTLRRNSLPSFAQATPGQKLQLVHKKSGKVQRAAVVDVQPETIVLDFNHPLAGKTLHYHVRVDEIRSATAQELEAGRVEQVIGEELGAGTPIESATPENTTTDETAA